MKLYIILISLFCPIYCSLHAQPAMDMMRLYDGNRTDGDLFADIYQTTEEDYFVCGQSDYNPWVLRLENNGNLTWEYQEEGVRLFSIIQADNGDAVTVGTIGEGNFGAIRLNSEGELVWRREYNDGRANAIIELKAGDFLICGSQNHRGYVIRINPAGEPLWQHHYGAEDGVSFLQSMRETEGGVVIVGQSINHGSTGWTIKIDTENGEVIWSQDYELLDPPRSLYFNSIVSAPFGFAIGGTHTGEERGFALYFIDPEGDVIQNHLYNLGGGYWFECLNKLSEGRGYILVGYNNAQRSYPFALRVDSDGNMIWHQNWSNIINQQPQRHDDIHNQLYSVIVQPEDVIVACGTMWNGDERLADGMVVRLNPDQLNPVIFYWDPIDTALTILPEDSIQFTVRARDQQGDELTYSWAIGDSVLAGNDTTRVIHFVDDLAENGDYYVLCSVSDEEWTSEIRWHITVSDFFVRECSPDSLHMTVRRGSTVPFKLDIACIEPDAPIVEWTVVNRDNDREFLGEADSIDVTFDLAGEWAVEAEAIWNNRRETVRWAVDVRSAVWWWMPHEDAIAVNQHDRRDFSVFPFDPDSDSLSVAWWLDGDLLDCDAEALSLDFPEFGEHSLTTVVRDGVEADTIAWRITVNEMGLANDPNTIPSELALYPPAPNPFNSTTTIGYSLPTAGNVRVAVFDLSGREVARLADGVMSAGTHEAVWQADGVASGLYFLLLDAENNHYTRKLMLLK